VQVGVRFKASRSLSDFQKKVEVFFNRVKDQTYSAARQNTPKDTGFARSQWKQSKTANRFEVSNKTPYIGKLERGHSKQAKRGITKPTVRKVAGYMNNTRRITR
jgi:hypothetical protein